MEQLASPYFRTSGGSRPSGARAATPRSLVTLVSENEERDPAESSLSPWRSRREARQSSLQGDRSLEHPSQGSAVRISPLVPYPSGSWQPSAGAENSLTQLTGHAPPSPRFPIDPRRDARTLARWRTRVTWPRRAAHEQEVSTPPAVPTLSAERSRKLVCSSRIVRNSGSLSGIARLAQRRRKRIVYRARLIRSGTIWLIARCARRAER